MVKRFFVAMLAALVSFSAHARELRLLEPRDVYVEAYRYTSIHDPYLYPIDTSLKYGGTFNVDANLFRYGKFSIYFLNKLHFDQADPSGHIKHAGWQYELGMPLWVHEGQPKLEFFKQHHSRHILEETRPLHFPVYDRFGIRLRLMP
jgi:hypothetical protein